MTCANWGVTILSLIIIILAVWPSLFATLVVQWIMIIAGLLIIIVCWTGCRCSCCDAPVKAKGKRR
jgi:hypothetical protein